MIDKRFVCTGAAVAAVVAISLMLVRIPEQEEVLPLREAVSDVEIPEESAPEKPGEPEYAYLLREHEGRIAVFLPGQEEPETIFDVHVKFLPEYDQEQMRKGIPAQDYNHLVSLIEDFIS